MQKMPWDAGGKKFDIQLGQALNHQRRLHDILSNCKIELKTETWQWEQTGNIAIEYRFRGKPSGIAATDADYWVHELRRGDETLIYLMWPVERLKEMARAAWKQGRYHEFAGDDDLACVVLIPLEWITT